MSKHVFASHLATLSCVLLLGNSCIPSLSQNKPREPNKAVPGSFGSRGGNGQGDGSGQQNWNSFFADDDLKALIDVSLKNNQELNIRQGKSSSPRPRSWPAPVSTFRS